jgi:hypothetical protein
MVLQAIQARRAAGLDQRADHDGVVAEHDGQVGEVASQPEPVALGVEHIVADHDAEIALVFRHSGAHGDLGAGKGEHVGDAFDRLAHTHD